MKWLHVQSEVAYLKMLFAGQRFREASRREEEREEKYRPDQPRVPAGNPDGGQWTDEGGASNGLVRVAQAGSALGVLDDANDSIVEQVQQPPRGPTRRVVIGGRPYDVISDGQQLRLEQSVQRADAAMARVRQGGDLTWQPTQNLTDPSSAEGAIRANLARAQQAEARALVLERGGIPLGFGGRTDFEAFGRTTWDGLARGGHRDATPYIKGSAVTGYSYRTGEAFDVGRRSDYDIAIVSPALMQRAAGAGVELRSGGTRTRELSPREMELLGLGTVVRDLRGQSGRKVTVMIYQSHQALEIRGPNLMLP